MSFSQKPLDRIKLKITTKAKRVISWKSVHRHRVAGQQVNN